MPAAGGLADYLSECDEPPGYMDFARVGPPLRAVRQAAASALEAAVGRGGDPMEPLDEMRRQATATAKEIVGMPGAEVGLMPSTSAALFAVAFGLPGEGSILVPDGEFPANVVPWVRAAARGGPEVRLVARAGDRFSLRALDDALDPSVRAVTVSAVDYATGWVAPLTGIRDLIGPDRLLIVDAIQGLGVSELELAVADVVVGGGQKWLRAGWGSAMMALSPHARDMLGVGLGGWPDFVDPLGAAETGNEAIPAISRFLMTNGDPVAIAAYGAAMAAVSAATVPALAGRLREVTDAIRIVLDRAGADVIGAIRPGAEQAGIVTFSIPGQVAQATVDRLARQGFTTAVRSHRVRLSPHVSTSPETIARFAQALQSG